VAEEPLGEALTNCGSEKPRGGLHKKWCYVDVIVVKDDIVVVVVMIVVLLLLSLLLWRATQQMVLC